MGNERTEGVITRGTTHPNRLRRIDRWLIACHGEVLTKGAEPPVVVDLGYGASGVTSAEWHARLRAVRPNVEVVGLEIDPARVEAALPYAREGLSFARGGFEVPLQGRSARVIRAINVLRQYGEDEVAPAWESMQRRLDPDGLLIEGTCSELGRLGSWVVLDRERPLTLTLSWRLRDLTEQSLPPSIVAERLPKVLIHRNVSGEPIHALLADLDQAWAHASAIAPFGPRQRMIAAVEALAQDWPIRGGAKRWRLGEVSVDWRAVAPVGQRA
ncbi:class I SAM-dependent methyltransferase [Janibacter sp. GXQ6167]|uniref:class I SAM-dependent methyltransferase n=1 Tax=Janibacter sp. GXQ6167 TaxID=3240791 RepID=UPI00352366BD